MELQHHQKTKETVWEMSYIEVLQMHYIAIQIKSKHLSVKCTDIAFIYQYKLFNAKYSNIESTESLFHYCEKSVELACTAFGNFVCQYFACGQTSVQCTPKKSRALANIVEVC